MVVDKAYARPSVPYFHDGKVDEVATVQVEVEDAIQKRISLIEQKKVEEKVDQSRKSEVRRTVPYFEDGKVEEVETVNVEAEDAEQQRISQTRNSSHNSLSYNAE